MQKELNPELFGERKTSKATTGISHGLSSSEPAYLNTDRQIFELRTQNHNLQEQINKLTAAFNELAKASNVKFDRSQQLLNRLEMSHNGLANEVGQKMTHLAQKISERKALDAKVQEMVDRHNNIVKSFEVRMSHLQKLLVEKDAQVVAAHTTLNEMKMELTRLKRL